MPETLQADWAELPLEVLQRIFGHFNDLDLLTVVAATCRTWRRAVHDNHNKSIDFSTLIDTHCVDDQTMYLVASLFGATLQSINLSGCQSLTSASFECLEQHFPALTKIVVNDLDIFHLGQCSLAKLAGVRELEMRQSRVTYRGSTYPRSSAPLATETFRRWVWQLGLLADAGPRHS